jgi:hypothetical protein
MGNPRTSHGGFLLGKLTIFMGENSVAMFVYWMVLAIFNEKKNTIFSSRRDGLSTSNPHKLGQHFSAKRCVEVGAFLRSMGIPGS